MARALANPAHLQFLALGEWSRLLRHAQRNQLLARLATLALGQESLGALPQLPRLQLEQARQAATAQRQQRQRDLQALMQLLEPAGFVVVALNGTAHWLHEIAPTNDQQCAGLDIWVDSGHWERLAATLRSGGWLPADTGPADQAGRVRWNAAPGAQGPVRRAAVLTVHSQMLPALPCAQAGLALQLQARLAVPEIPGLHVPAPSDLVLCAVAQVFHTDGGAQALRDLSDVDVLLRRFAPQPAFWSDLVQRAAELELSRALYYGLRHSVRLFATPVPDSARRARRAVAPPLRMNRLMDGLWSRVLCTPHASGRQSIRQFCRDLLRLRARWLRVVAACTVRQ